MGARAAGIGHSGPFPVARREVFVYNTEEEGRAFCPLTPLLNLKEGNTMKHIKTIQTACLKAQGYGCGECQASCQSACKTSCTVANQKCQKKA